MLSDDGKSVEIDSPEGEKALTFMADGIKNGAAPKAVTTYKEEESRRAFESGNAQLHAQLAVRVLARQGVEDRQGLRHRDLPELRAAESRPACWAGSTWRSRPTRRTRTRRRRSSPLPRGRRCRRRTSSSRPSPPATAAAYDDPAVQKKYAFATDLRDAIEQGQSRPVSPVYPQINEAIYTNVHQALQGKTDPEVCLDDRCRTRSRRRSRRSRWKPPP